MQTRPQMSTAATEFVAAVGGHLADLAPGDRAELVAPVEQRLLDLSHAASTYRQLDEIFGSPARVAADLRIAAGFPAGPTAPLQQYPALAQWPRDVGRHRLVAPVVAYVVSLRPAWWAVRGFLLFAAGLAIISQGAGYRLHTLGYYSHAFDRSDSHLTSVWLLGPLATVVASIVLGVLGRRLSRPLQLVPVALNVVAVIALLAWPTWWMGPAFAFYGGLVT